jgi:hypothetical protein
VEVASLSDDYPCPPSLQFAAVPVMTTASRVDHEALLVQGLLPVQAWVQGQALV